MKNLIEISPLIRAKRTDLLDMPIIIKVGDINAEAAEEFSHDISKAHNTGQPVIPILIDSFGGDIYALMTMVSAIQQCKVPVATIAMGKAMSAGAVLLVCGTPKYRFSDPNTTIMIHDVALDASGKNEEVKASSKQTDRLQKHIFKLMADSCGQDDKAYFLKLIHEKSHAEWYMTPQEAKKHGMIDYVRVPTMRTIVSVDMRFE